MKKAVFFAFLMLLASSRSALAVGISPPYREVYFQPGFSESFYFFTFSNLNYDLQVMPYVEGDLAQYVALDNRTFTIPKGKGAMLFVNISLPDELPPGKHMLRVGIMEAKQTESSGIGVTAKLGVESLIGIRVPFPAKYVELKMLCHDTEAGMDVPVSVDALNLGSMDLQDVSGYVEFFSPEHIKLGKAVMEEGSLYLKPAESGHFTSSWNTTGNGPGYYEAVATINYDGNETSTDCMFRLGSLNINIADFHANDTIAGGIAKFAALLQSTWNSDIPQVFTSVEITAKDGSKVGSSRGETIRIGRWKEQEVLLYWDTGNAPAGEYGAKLLLEYEGMNSTKTAQFRIAMPFEVPWHYFIIAALLLVAAYQAAKSSRKFSKNIKTRASNKKHAGHKAKKQA